MLLMTFEYRNPCGHCVEKKPQPGADCRCLNLLTNPSFEAGLTGWTASNNVVAGNELPFEGTQVANFLTGVAFLFQDVSLEGLCNSPLFLSFNVVSNEQPKFTVEVIWLDIERDPIGTGLRMFIPPNTTDNPNASNARVTFFNITDRPPKEAAYARLLFSKAFSEEDSFVSLDQVVLVPVKTGNLVNNPGFEAGLTDWSGPTFQPNFVAPLEGVADAFTSTGGTLSQDVPIDNQPANSSYVLSFGAFAQGISVPLLVRVLWLDQGGNTIGPPGLNIDLPIGTLGVQDNYLTYLDLTDPAPAGAVTARILFNPGVTEEDSFFKLDQVILARAGTANLVENPSFENGEEGWTFVNALVEGSIDSYEGASVAIIDVDGGVIFQDVPLANAAGHCFLFNCGLKVRRSALESAFSDALVKVLWLDDRGREIGVGLNLVTFGFARLGGASSQWLVYTGITEQAPPGTAAARIQISKLSGSSAFLEVDKVVFGRLV
jgi:hypothetical protein